MRKVYINNDDPDECNCGCCRCWRNFMIFLCCYEVKDNSD